jgi:hypothetical protein
MNAVTPSCEGSSIRSGSVPLLYRHGYQRRPNDFCQTPSWVSAISRRVDRGSCFSVAGRGGVPLAQVAE